jgi:DNA-binding response OmpR family regulator
VSAKHVLVVDDSEFVREIMTATLGRAGFRVTAIGSFDQLSALELSDFALFLMDVDMPELFGDDVATVLRHDRGIAAPIYMLSSAPIDELAARASEAGIEGYLSKHEGFEQVVARVTEILSR